MQLLTLPSLLPRAPARLPAATTLCSLHFFTSALTVKVLEYVNAEKRGTMPLKGALP